MEVFFRRLSRRLHGDRRAVRGGGRRTSDYEPNRGWLPAAALAVWIAVLDWTTKWAVSGRVALGDLVVVWEDRVALWHVRNDAMILGLYGDLPLGARKVIAVVAALLGALFLFQIIGRGHRLGPGRRSFAWTFVGLAAGGMLGNLGERAVHWGVTDFLSFRWGELWLPPGNVADLALFLSIPFAFLVIAFELEGRSQRAAEDEPGLPGGAPEAAAEG